MTSSVAALLAGNASSLECLVVRRSIFTQISLQKGERGTTTEENCSPLWNHAKPNLLLLFEKRLEVLLHFRAPCSWEGWVSRPAALELCCLCVVLQCVCPCMMEHFTLLSTISVKRICSLGEAYIVQDMSCPCSTITAYPTVLFIISLEQCALEPSVLALRSCSCWTPVVLVTGFFWMFLLVWSQALKSPCALEEDLSLMPNSVTKGWALVRSVGMTVDLLPCIRSNSFWLSHHLLYICNTYIANFCLNFLLSAESLGGTMWLILCTSVVWVLLLHTYFSRVGDCVYLQAWLNLITFIWILKLLLTRLSFLLFQVLMEWRVARPVGNCCRALHFNCSTAY